MLFMETQALAALKVSHFILPRPNTHLAAPSLLKPQEDPSHTAGVYRQHIKP